MFDDFIVTIQTYWSCKVTPAELGGILDMQDKLCCIVDPETLQTS